MKLFQVLSNISILYSVDSIIDSAYSVGIVLLIILAIFAFISLTAIHIIYSIFLNKAHKLLYKEETIISWIPLINFYITGKIAHNKKLGIITLLIELIPVLLIVIIKITDIKILALLVSISIRFILIYILIITIFAFINYDNYKKEERINNKKRVK